MSNAISGEAVTAALRRTARVVINHEEQFTALDQAVGDGDLGITLTKIGQALVDFADLAAVDDIGKWLGKAGMIANKVGSSSFGTLLATALMRAGKVVAGQTDLTPDDLAAMFSAAYTGMQERGKADLGDKTVLDAMYPASVAFAEAIAAGADPRAAGVLTLHAAEVGRDSVTPLQSKVGRAGWVGERGEGKVDPGCEALVVMLRAMVG